MTEATTDQASEKKKNFLAFLLGFVFLFVIWWALEVFFFLNTQYKWLKPHSAVRLEKKVAVSDPKLSAELHEVLKNNKVSQWTSPLRPEDNDGEIADYSQKERLPCCVATEEPLRSRDFQSIARTYAGKLVYSAHYTTDKAGRRITPQRPNARYNIVAVGDSFTFGEGVNNEESYPFVLANFRPEAQVYNLGISGGSPNEVLYELTTPPYKRIEDIKKQKTLVVYSFIDDHLERLLVRSYVVTKLWMRRRPYYEFVDGHVQYSGIFLRDRQLTNLIYGFIAQDYFLNFFDVVWPLQFTQTDFDFFGEMMAKAAKAAKNKFGEDSEFVLVIYPGNGDEYGAQVSEATAKKGIRVLNYSNLQLDLPSDKAIIRGDGHPSPLLQYVMAYLLDRDLPKY